MSGPIGGPIWLKGHPPRHLWVADVLTFTLHLVPHYRRHTLLLLTYTTPHSLFFVVVHQRSESWQCSKSPWSFLLMPLFHAVALYMGKCHFFSIWSTRAPDSQWCLISILCSLSLVPEQHKEDMRPLASQSPSGVMDAWYIAIHVNNNKWTRDVAYSKTPKCVRLPYEQNKAIQGQSESRHISQSQVSRCKTLGGNLLQSGS